MTLRKTYLYAGSWKKTVSGQEGSGGLTVFEQHPETGELTMTGRFHEHLAVGSIGFAPNSPTLYALDEAKHSTGHTGGTVHAFNIEPATGGLSHISSAPTMGSYPCSLTVDPKGDFLAVANYGSEDSVVRSETTPEGRRLIKLNDEGSTALFRIRADGSVSDATDIAVHTRSSGVDKTWQTAPHPHAVGFSPSGDRLVTCDRGGDTVTVYAVDRENGALDLESELCAEPGWGPRSIAFSATLPYFVISSELQAKAASFYLDPKTGDCVQIGSVGTEPAGFRPENPTDFFSRTHPSAVAVHPRLPCAYVLNRGHNSVARFDLDAGTGKLQFMEATPSEGDAPWALALDGPGRFLYVGNQGSGKIVIFAVDASTGALRPTGAVAYTPRLASLSWFCLSES